MYHCTNKEDYWGPLKKGCVYKTISKASGLHQFTVRQRVYKWRKIKTIVNLFRSGRPTKISPRTWCVTVSQVTKNPRGTSKKLLLLYYYFYYYINIILIIYSYYLLYSILILMFMSPPPWFMGLDGLPSLTKQWIQHYSSKGTKWKCQDICPWTESQEEDLLSCLMMFQVIFKHLCITIKVINIHIFYMMSWWRDVVPQQSN